MCILCLGPTKLILWLTDSPLVDVNCVNKNKYKNKHLFVLVATVVVVINFKYEQNISSLKTKVTKSIKH